MQWLRVAAIAAMVAGPAAAQDMPCLTDAEARSVIVYALPAALDAAAARCRPVLPAASWLNRGAAGLAARYRREGGGDPAAALAVVERISGQTMPDLLDPSSVSTIVEQIVADRVGTALATRDCAAVGRIAEQISPLPIGNVASLLVALVQLDRGTGSRTGLRICAAAGAR